MTRFKNKLCVADTPFKRIGTPAEVAAVVAMLASDDGAYMSGAMIPVDGGLCAGPVD